MVILLVGNFTAEKSLFFNKVYNWNEKFQSKRINQIIQSFNSDCMWPRHIPTILLAIKTAGLYAATLHWDHVSPPNKHFISLT